MTSNWTVSWRSGLTGAELILLAASPALFRAFGPGRVVSACGALFAAFGLYGFARHAEPREA